jgi:hypothetical protein
MNTRLSTSVLSSWRTCILARGKGGGIIRPGQSAVGTARGPEIPSLAAGWSHRRVGGNDCFGGLLGGGLWAHHTRSPSGACCILYQGSR